MREPEFEVIEPHASRLKEPAFSSLLANVWAAKVSPELPLSSLSQSKGFMLFVTLLRASARRRRSQPARPGLRMTRDFQCGVQRFSPAL